MNFTGETTSQHHVTLAGRLPFGQGVIGQQYPLESAEAERQFAAELGKYIRPITIQNTADCVDDRPIIGFHNGASDSETIKRRITYQLPGGLGLAVTKAAVGAEASFLRDASDFWDAYRKTVDFLQRLGYQESAHQDCGASKNVKVTVENQVAKPQLEATLPVLGVDERTAYLFERNTQAKRDKLKSKFYDTWNPVRHADFVKLLSPQNFAYLAEKRDDHETHGHYASGLLVVRAPGVGFAKTAFAHETGRMAFSDTPSLVEELVQKIAKSEEERDRLRLEFAADAVNVVNVLVPPNFPAFALAA